MATETADMTTFLPRLIEAFEKIKVTPGVEGQSAQVDAASFAEACEPLLDAFTLMGSVLAWGKADFDGKRKSIVTAAAEFETLDQIVEADKKAGTLGVKDSNARNLHRLKCGVHFVIVMLERLCGDANKSTREAAGEAYAETLQAIHNWAVQAAVQASLLTVPTREHFLSSIQETDESSKELVAKFAKIADPIVALVHELYKDGAPPPSSTWGGGGGGWGWGSSK